MSDSQPHNLTSKEQVYGRCERCGGALIAGHDCAKPLESIAALAVMTAKGSYIGAPAAFKLELACQHVAAAFRAYDSFGIYQVGSSLKRADWRDVDLRMILSDEGFYRLFPNVKPDHGTWELDPLWLLLTVAISGWFREQTGLPIDFQFQPQTHANTVHKGSRNAVGIRLRGETP